MPAPSIPGGWSAPRYPTGIRDLDARISGLGTGELWILTSAPGQGRSTLLTQIATHVAVQHRLATWLFSSRDPAHVVSARAHSAAGRIPLGDLQNDRVDDSQSRLETARDVLKAAQLNIVAHRPAASITCADQELRKLSEPTALFFDDPDVEPGWDLSHAHRLTRAGAIVVVALPREQVLAGDAYHCDLEPAMRLADLVLEIRLHNLAAAEPDHELVEPGHAAIAVVRNRRGPVGTVGVAFQGHYARFVDIRSGPPSPT